jgi:hypothetical protein
MQHSGLEKVLNEHWRNTVKKFYDRGVNNESCLSPNRASSFIVAERIKF